MFACLQIKINSHTQIDIHLGKLTTNRSKVIPVLDHFFVYFSFFENVLMILRLTLCSLTGKKCLLDFRCYAFCAQFLFLFHLCCGLDVEFNCISFKHFHVCFILNTAFRN